MVCTKDDDQLRTHENLRQECILPFRLSGTINHNIKSKIDTFIMQKRSNKLFFISYSIISKTKFLLPTRVTPDLPCEKALHRSFLFGTTLNPNGKRIGLSHFSSWWTQMFPQDNLMVWVQFPQKETSKKFLLFLLLVLLLVVCFRIFLRHWSRVNLLGIF